MNLDFHKLLLNALKAVCFSVFVVKFYQKMIHHTFRYTTSCFLSLWINIFNYLSSRSSKSNFQFLGIKKVQAEKNKS